MKINKEDSLFLYGLLFHCSVSQDLGHEVDAKVVDILNDLSTHLLEDSSEAVDDVSTDKVDDDIHGDDEDPSFVAEKFVSPADLSDLPRLSVSTPAGDAAKLEFEDVDEPSHVDALIDGGSVIIDTVTHVTVTSDGKRVKLYDGEEWHSFEVKKASKAWSGLFEKGVVYGVSTDSDADEEEE